MSEINFIDYDKITIHSDAFVTSEELNCYLQYLPSTKALSYNIKKDKHTAGTTDDPDDYKIPDIRSKLSPKKLYRINPFHKNNAEYLELYKTNVDPEIIFPTETKEVKIVENDYSDMGLNQDQLDFLLALKNLKNLKADDISKKLDLEQFAITDEKLLEGFFQLYPRYMESLVTSSGLQETIAYEEEPEESMSYNEDSSSMAYHLKKMGLDPNEVTVKKNFQVRTGNAKENQINSFLQDKSVENTINQKISNSISTKNITNIDLSNSEKQYLSRLSSTSYNNNQAYNSLVQNINQSKNIIVNQDIRIRKSSEKEIIDFKSVFNNLIKDLSLKNDVTNLYNREINLHSRNITFEFLSQINQSFSKEYNTNIRNQTSAYNFYRSIENKYREFVQNLNFFNETFQEFKRTEYKIRNSYQNIHQHNFTQKNQYNKSVINLTEEINFENNMIDYNFQSAILKTVEKTNTITKNNIEKIKESLNVVQDNVQYVNQKVSNVNYKTINRLSNQIKNILNNQEFSDDYASIIISKISNIAKSTEIKNILSVVKNEDTLQNLSYIFRQSNVNTENIKSISEIVNLSKNNNFNIQKISNESIQNIKNILSLSESINKNYNTQDILKNLTQNFRTSNISNYNKTSNLVSNVNNTFEKNFNLQKLSQIKDINIFDQINIISEPKINKTIKVLRKLKQINNIENLDQNISLVNQTLSDKKEYFVKTSNVNKVNKFINLIENSKLNSTQINAISQLSVQNLSNIVQTINNISNNDNNINKIVNEISKISENKITKISNINQNQIQNINLTKNEVQSVVRLERQIRSYSEKVKVRETLKTLDLVQSNPDINQIFTNKISYTKLNQISEVLQNINLTKTEKNLEVIKKYSFDSNKKNISNFFNELNVVSLFKTERKTEKTFSSINKQIDRLYRMNERVESKAARAEQSFYDLINFSDYSVTKKTSTKKEIKNFFQTLNQVKITNEQVRQRTKPSVKVNEFRITQR